ncbi:SDR family NAD(P)-dependent oxidoreductase [Bradyrhizobium roseum]|uniref:SDR family NAD(P)-dependent oxidoreductase n=1 Tax=Bradyrhizobium roseum TaxID=3056648 RepID=UPI002613FC27|nr:SDR family oxidoreductase [Bradyrhizobium roseus]WKA26483.1 SDR family oxidoreductase [Bradyrhizobium roseus]
MKIPGNSAAIVTGGSRGIGAAIIRALHERGIATVNIDRSPPTEPSPATFIEADLADPDARAAALRIVKERYTPLWLVNNAAIVAPASIDDVTTEDFNRVITLNLLAVIACTQAVVPAMRAAGFGRILNISSRAAIGKELRTVYAATKAGVLGMTKTWALELGPCGITVNAIGPGPIETDLFRASNPPDSPRTRAILEAIPLKRLGRVEDIAHAASFFLSDEASFVTGQTLYVCGGLTIGNAAA